MSNRRSSCPLCAAEDRPIYRVVDGRAYYECAECDFLFMDDAVYSAVDAGHAIVKYDDGYWSAELAAARERSRGAALARVAEALLYCRVPVERFVDIGSGPGYLLDALARALPCSKLKFHGVERFPPAPEQRTTHPNYVIGPLSAAGQFFQCGCCIEVIEHLTPNMMRSLAAELAAVSSPGACYIFNTGLTDYVREEDPGYLDPAGRGHISIWSVSAARRIFTAPAFRVHAIPGKTWAFLVEFDPRSPVADECVTDRIWSACEENLRMLKDPQTGSIMYILGIDTARAYR